MSLSDALSLISLIVTVMLGVLAIWITFHFKYEADKVNQETRSLLIEVKTDAKALTQVAQSAMSELQEYGKTSRALILGRVPEMQVGVSHPPEERSNMPAPNSDQAPQVEGQTPPMSERENES
jgi:hypothetical protein